MNVRVPAAIRVSVLLAGIVGLLAVVGTSWSDTALPAGAKPCAKFAGPVLMTYSSPQTIIIHIIKGKVNAATVFTMTPATAYTRNGLPATFADIKAGDNATICAVEQLPSGTLLASWVEATGP